MTSERPDAAPIDRHPRVPGYDVARAIAICGMVLINFGVYLLGPPRGTPGEVVWRWLAHLPGGRASSLFVTLAGVGIARMAYGDVALARRTLLERSAILVVLGAINLVFLRWNIDILHFYACYLAIAAIFFLRATPRALLGSAIAVGLSGGLFAIAFPADARVDLPLFEMRVMPFAGVPWKIPFFSILGVLRDALVDGIHPVLPWLAFLLFGMWLGQRDLESVTVRRTILARALGTFVIAEASSLAVSSWLVRGGETTHAGWLGLTHTDWSPSPFYVLSATASATTIIALSHELVAWRPQGRLVGIASRAGQLSLTLYLVHAHLAIGIPRFFLGLADAMPVETMLLYWLAFVLTVIPLAALYRRRFQRGPVEWLMRRLSGSPEHVPPLPRDDAPARAPSVAAILALASVAALLPVVDVIGVAPPQLTCPDRAPVTIGSETASQLTLACPRARFAIELVTQTPVVLATRSGLDVYLEVRREGTMVAENDDGGPGLDARIETTLAPGRYDVDVRPYSAATGPFVLITSRGAGGALAMVLSPRSVDTRPHAHPRRVRARALALADRL